MGSKWRKAKLALGLNLCLYVPKTLEDSSSPSRRSDDTVSLSPVMAPRPTTPVPSSSGLRLPRSISRKSSSKVGFFPSISSHFYDFCFFRIVNSSQSSVFFTESLIFLICVRYLGVSDSLPLGFISRVEFSFWVKFVLLILKLVLLPKGYTCEISIFGHRWIAGSLCGSKLVTWLRQQIQGLIFLGTPKIDLIYF